MSENNQLPVSAPNPSLYKPTAVYMFLAYFLWPFCLIGLKLEREDGLIRFNCAQAMTIFFLQVAIGLLYLLGIATLWIFIGFAFIAIAIILFLGTYVLVIIALIKAANGSKYLLPVVGTFSEKYIMKWFSK